MMTLDEYDLPVYGGTPIQEAHLEMLLVFGSENPDQEWILTDFDVWERNPFYAGAPGPHPEDYPWEECDKAASEPPLPPPTQLEEDDDEYPF